MKPGVAVWDWRINGAKVDGFKYEMSLPSWKRMVDFAAENHIRHLVLDANWYGPEFGKDSDPDEGRQGRRRCARSSPTAKPRASASGSI